ncbi:HNH endonuclease (plasmid) [Kovacikia minuta CCNUW1]|uniref:HNH endonuclease n=1 Tax=Kovacikia minuta TaxID=2931930 RepID=UPI001CCC2218|nr:HNH endonuclease [Kovacikia minuta]UBF30791.1 HNH endonuclease [Kovacikia minuta CCNUW1]
MDLFQEAQKLTNAAENLVQAGTNQLNESVAAVKNAAAGLGATVDEFNQQSGQLAQQGFKAVSGTFDAVTQAAFELGVTGGAIAEALKDLPHTAEALAREMPKIAYRLRNRAGLRVGDAPRSDADVMKQFEKIPGTSKLGASETRIREFLADKHGSHVISRQQGGSNAANNILWEIGTDNLQRGARVMTGGEQVYIRFYNAVDSIVKNSGTIAKLGLTATGTAVLTQAVVTAVSYALDLYRGDITVEEFRDRIVEAAVSAGIATPIFFLIFIAVIALFPEVAVLLSAPAVVAGFNALFGLGIAIPIIQSLVRHVEVGGFREEVAEGYQSLMGNAQQFMESTAGEI